MGEVYPRAISLAARRLIDIRSIVSHRYSLDDVTDAFETARRRVGHKDIVEPAMVISPGAAGEFRRS